MAKKIDELFEDDFSDSEKAAVAERVMEIQDRVHHSEMKNIVTSALFCAACLIMFGFSLIHFWEIVEYEDPRNVPTFPSGRHLTGAAGVAEQVIYIMLLPFSICMPVMAAESAEKENKRYREFTARKFSVFNVAEHESVKGLYTVTANYNDQQICFDTSDSAAKDYDKGSVMIVVEFLGVNENAPEKNYGYYTASAEERKQMAFSKASKNKYVIIHI